MSGFLFFLALSALGVGAAVLYELFALTGRVFRIKKVGTFTLDFLFVTLVVGALFILILFTQNGVFRLFMPIVCLLFFAPSRKLLRRSFSAAEKRVRKLLNNCRKSAKAMVVGGNDGNNTE